MTTRRFRSRRLEVAKALLLNEARHAACGRALRLQSSARDANGCTCTATVHRHRPVACGAGRELGSRRAHRCPACQMVPKEEVRLLAAGKGLHPEWQT